MAKYILKRILSSLIVLLGVITITFVIARVIPSNAAAKWVGPKATPEQIAAAEIELGLDKPLPIQFVNYLKQLAQGDLGTSLNTHQPVIKELQAYVPATLELVLIAFLLGQEEGPAIGPCEPVFLHRGGIPAHLLGSPVPPIDFL